MGGKCRLLVRVLVSAVAGGLAGLLLAEVAGLWLATADAGRDPAAWAGGVAATLRARLPWGVAAWAVALTLLGELPRLLWGGPADPSRGRQPPESSPELRQPKPKDSGG